MNTLPCGPGPLGDSGPGLVHLSDALAQAIPSLGIAPRPLVLPPCPTLRDFYEVFVPLLQGRRLEEVTIAPRVPFLKTAENPDGTLAVYGLHPPGSARQLYSLNAREVVLAQTAGPFILSGFVTLDCEIPREHLTYRLYRANPQGEAAFRDLLRARFRALLGERLLSHKRSEGRDA